MVHHLPTGLKSMYDLARSEELCNIQTEFWMPES